MARYLKSDECEEIMAMHAKTARYGQLCVRLGDL